MTSPKLPKTILRKYISGKSPGLYKTVLKQYLRDRGAEKISADALTEYQLEIGSFASSLAKALSLLLQRYKRKTITKEDVILVLRIYETISRPQTTEWEGKERITAEALEEYRLEVEKFASAIAEHIVLMAKHGHRKTILPGDVIEIMTHIRALL
jgi:histone H3/H4